jgi:exopolysaccharide production protein ExoZ
MTFCNDKLHSWYETDPSEKRILSMEGLRGLAIALVFICHFQIVILERLAGSFHSKLFLTIAEIGGTGVDLFFLLSGMLIYRAAMKPNLHYGKFLLRRVQRIYPAFLVVLLLYVVLSVVFHIGEHHKAAGFQGEIIYLLENIFLLPGVIDVPPVIAAAWSLSYEFSFYLSVPLLVRVLALRRWRPRSRAAFWAVIIFTYLAFVLIEPGLFPRYQYFDGSFVRFTLFLGGMVIEEVLMSERGPALLAPRVQWCLLLSGAIAAAVLFVSEWHTVDSPIHRGTEHAVIRAFLVLIVYVGLALTTLNSKGLLSKFFSGTAIRWTGNISYSFYLIHGFTLNVLALLIAHLAWAKRHPPIAVPLLFVLALLSTFATATVLFLAVEKPYSLRPRANRRIRPVDVQTVALARKHQEV